MRNGIKWFILFGLLFLLFGLFAACSQTSGLGDQQVASIILAYGVPYTDYYLDQGGRPVTNSPVNATGKWRAVSEGEGKWRVQGDVVVVYPQGEKRCSTVWTYVSSGEIQLVSFDCG